MRLPGAVCVTCIRTLTQGGAGAHSGTGKVLAGRHGFLPVRKRILAFPLMIRVVGTRRNEGKFKCYTGNYSPSAAWV